MKNIFEEIYQQETELKKQYDAADDAGKDNIRAEHKALMERIAGLDGAAPLIWREYDKARENGNELLDINDVAGTRMLKRWSPPCGSTALRNSPFLPAGAVRLIPHGFSSRTAASWRGWLKSAATWTTSRVNMKSCTATFSA